MWNTVEQEPAAPASAGAEVDSRQERGTSRAGAHASEDLANIVVLSSSLLTDRMFLYTDFFASLTERARVRVWATSFGTSEHGGLWEAPQADVGRFPEVLPFREVPHNLLRAMNQHVWDFRYQPPSRLSMWRHKRAKTQAPLFRLTRIPARALAMARAGSIFERGLEQFLVRYPRSPEATKRFRAERPDVVITTGPFQFEQPAVVAAAKTEGIPAIAFIPSWDNVTTKGRLLFRYDGYVVWSEQTKRELHQYYPQTRDVPIYVVGAPQFDVFFQDRFVVSREDFCASYGLDPSLPIIVHTMGSPNMFREEHGALHMIERVKRGDLGNVQMLVRPHPAHDNGEIAALVGELPPNIVLQKTAKAGTALTSRSQDVEGIREWVNTFRHAAVVINLSSTVAVDAAIFDKPVVNLDFDPEPGQPKQALVKDVNHHWSHFKPIAESGGVWLVNDLDEMVEATRTYLRQPELHRTERRWIAEYVCQYLDGQCGRRMGDALLDFVRRRREPSAPERPLTER